MVRKLYKETKAEVLIFSHLQRSKGLGKILEGKERGEKGKEDDQDEKWERDFRDAFKVNNRS